MKRRPPMAIEYPKAMETPSQKKDKATELHKNTLGSWIAKLVRPRTVGPLLFLGLCIAVAYKHRIKKLEEKDVAGSTRPARPRHVSQRSVSIATLHGGKLALERIMDAQEARIDEKALEEEANKLPALLAEEPPNFNKLQRCIAKLEMSGKEDWAVEMLSKAWEKADKAGHTHEAYELQMLLVEMLIYKGEYQQALDCKCLNDKEISDARGPLYKAVIHTILNNKEKAEESYKEFQEIRSRFHWPEGLREGSPLYGVVHDFPSFERIVQNMKKEIDHAHEHKQLEGMAA